MKNSAPSICQFAAAPAWRKELTSPAPGPFAKPVPSVIHPFGNPYLLRVRVLGREVHKGRNAIRLSVGMQKIDRKTQELQPYKKLKQDATLWLSDDAARIPIEFRAAIFIGDVRATLVGHRKD